MASVGLAAATNKLEFTYSIQCIPRRVAKATVPASMASPMVGSVALTVGCGGAERCSLPSDAVFNSCEVKGVDNVTANNMR